MKKNNHLKPCREHIKVWVMIIIALIFIILLTKITYAFDFDNTKKVTKEEGKKYPKIEIINAFGMGDTLAKYELIKNTEACIINCYAEGTVDLYSSESIFNGIKFEDIKGKNINYNVNFYINSSQEYEIETPIYKETCKKVFNATEGKEKDVCTYSLDKINKDKLTKEVWKKYSGEIMPIGNYKWRIAGNIKIGDKVDWITNAFRKDFDEWAWWNSTWQYKQPIQITGDISKNYSIQINVTKTTGMNSDFSDLRLINNTEDGEIPYWIEYNDSNVAYIWFKVLNNKTIYLYYGNPSATTTGNIKDTFIYGDDFNDGAVDSIWTQKTAGGGAISESGTNISLTNALGGYAVIYTNNVSDFGVNVSAAAKFYVNEANGVRGVGFSNCNGGGANPCGASDKRSVLTSSGADFGLRNDGAFVTNGFTIDTDSYSIYEVRRLDTYSQAKSGVDINTSSMNADYFINNTVAFNSGNVSLAIFAEDGNVNPVTFTDWAYVRRYILPEPNATIGSTYFLREVNLVSPENNTNTLSSNLLFNASLSNPNGIIANATIFIWHNNGTLFFTNYTNLSGISNYSLFNISGLIAGTYLWNVMKCNDSSSYIYSPYNFTFTRQSFESDQVFYNNQTLETDNSTFLINISTEAGTKLFSANLEYNGTPHGSTITNLGGGKYQIKNIIDIPAVLGSTIKNFRWSFVMDTGAGYNTENTNYMIQTVNSTNITFAGLSTGVNYTIWDEESLSPTSANFEGTFDWYLGGGTVKENVSYNLASLSHTFNFTNLQDNRTYITNVNILLKNNSVNSPYSSRQFYFNSEKFTNITTERLLLMPNSTTTSNIIIEVKDEGYNALSDYIVKIYRYYPKDNTYRLVENRKTDDFGQFVAKLVQNEVNYKFEFYSLDNTLVKTASVVNIACRSSICTIPFIIQDTTDQFERYDNLTNYQSSLTFNNATNIFLFTWIDNTGTSPVTHNLEVIKKGFNGTLIICNSTSNSLASSLSCAVGNGEASYFASAYRIASPGIRKQVLTIKVGAISSIFEREGLIWSLVLLLTLVSVGIFNPPIAVVLYLGGFLFLGVFGIVYINPALFIAQLVLGVFFIWAFRS